MLDGATGPQALQTAADAARTAANTFPWAQLGTMIIAGALLAFTLGPRIAAKLGLGSSAVPACPAGNPENCKAFQEARAHRTEDERRAEREANERATRQLLADSVAAAVRTTLEAVEARVRGTETAAQGAERHAKATLDRIVAVDAAREASEAAHEAALNAAETAEKVFGRLQTIETAVQALTADNKNNMGRGSSATDRGAERAKP